MDRRRYHLRAALCGPLAVPCGSAAPVSFAGAQSLETEPAGEIYTLGGVSLNGADIDTVQNVTIDFGIDVWVDGGSGLTYPTHCAIANRQPTISICRDC